MKKILIICAGLQLGGAEKVAADISLYAPPDEFEFHYLTFEGYANDYGSEIEARGGTVLVWPSPACGYGAYIKRLDKLMRTNCYAAVHSHTMFNSGINLLVARKNRIPVRIAHSHTTKTETTVSVQQKLYEMVMRLSIAMFATDYFACGREAGEWLFGKRLFARKGIIISNGIDTKRFAFSAENRKKVRHELGLTDDAFVIGHSGTLIPLKNQSFLIRLMPQVCKVIPNATLVLLGRGDEKNIEVLNREIEDCGMEKHVLLYGETRRVYEFLSAFDVFAMPSLREGTPLSLLEAQINGLPCIVSDRIPNDAFVTDLVQVLPLESEKWVEKICCVVRRNALLYAAFMKERGFDVHETYQSVYRSYQGRRELDRGIIAFSFDDGRVDNYTIVRQFLKSQNIPATFNITTGYVDGSCPKALLPTNKAAMSIDNVKLLGLDTLFELALHGNNHLNTAEDIAAGREKMMKWLDLSEPYLFGFASPGSGINLSDAEFLKVEPFRSGVSYIRTGLRYRTMKHIRILARKAGRVIHWPVFYKIAYSNTFMLPGNGRVLYSVPIMSDITVEQVAGLIDMCIKHRCALILMLHSIEERPQDPWAWSVSKFQTLCNYLVEQKDCGKLDIETVKNMYELIK